MKLRCPKCRQSFPWKSNTAFPDKCLICKQFIGSEDDVGEDGVIEIKAPFISRRHEGSTYADTVYREIEASSELRVEQAAAMAGVDKSEMAGLKITNLQSSPRPGDVAAMPIANPTPVSEMMRAAPGLTGFVGSNGVEYGGAVMSGPSPNAGARTRTAIQNTHYQMVQQHCVGKGEDGRPAMPNMNVISDRPALETTQPGYRRRG